MNERIKELAGQAKFIAEESINRQISKNAELDAFAEKFAELIVRECVTHIEEDRFRKVDLRETEYDDGYLDGLGHAERILKEHFGL